MQFKNKQLEKFFNGEVNGIPSKNSERVSCILSLLESATCEKDLYTVPRALKLHRLKGKKKGSFSMSINKNYRITYKFDNKEAVEIDYLDYHS